MIVYLCLYFMRADTLAQSFLVLARSTSVFFKWKMMVWLFIYTFLNTYFFFLPSSKLARCSYKQINVKMYKSIQSEMNARVCMRKRVILLVRIRDHTKNCAEKKRVFMYAQYTSICVGRQIFYSILLSLFVYFVTIDCACAWCIMGWQRHIYSFQRISGFKYSTHTCKLSETRKNTTKSYQTNILIPFHLLS